LLAALKFVRGAVATKDFVPALTHFCIANHMVKGFNGAVALCSPIPLDFDATPRADTFVKAVEACKEVVQLNLTEEGSLAIRSGKFSAFVDCSPDPFPAIYPEGDKVSIKEGFFEVVKLLAPFIAEDASRKWANGILFRGKSAFATNNVILVERWLGYDFPVEVNISKAAVAELLRIGEEPTSMQVCKESVTFHYAGDKWLRAQNSPVEWPDVEAVLGRSAAPTRPLTKEFFSALADLAPFVDEAGEVYFLDGALSTSQEEKKGARVKVEGICHGPVFNCSQLRLLSKVASSAAFELYPKPSIFYGDNLTRGVIVGIIRP